MEFNNPNEDNNIIVELDNNLEDTLYDENVSEEVKLDDDQIKVTKKKRKKEFFWKRLSKKGKIIIIVIGIIILLAIIGVVLYFTVFKKDKKEVPTEEVVVIQKDNYIYEDGKLKFLNANDKEIGTYDCKDKDDTKCYVAKYSNEDEFDLPKYVDKDGKEIDKLSKIFNDRYVFVYDDKKISLYDIKEEKSLEEYKLIKTGNIDKNIVVVKNSDDKYGVISFEGDEYKNVLDAKYEYLGIINSSEKIVVKEKGSSYLIDLDGKSASSKISGDIKNFDDNYIAVLSGDDYLLYDYKGKKVLDDKFDYIDFNSKYVFGIKSTRMFIYDDSLFKITENGIKIKSSEYQKTYVFDEKNNLSETKKAYDINVTSGNITVEVIESKNNSNTKEINLYEVALSKKTDYISYLDGVLYIYDDLDKKELLGSYTCNNKNEINSSSESFNNCFVATDTNIANNIENVGYTPIFNSNYAFIKDVKEGSTNNMIVLYDLKTSASKAKYQAIDTGLSDEKITHVSSQNNLIYAKNMDGNYGVITFGNNGPEGLIAFKDSNGTTSSISILDDYILVKRGSKNLLYTKIGKLVASSEFDIKEYANNYLVVKDKKYLIYNMTSTESGTIISDEQDYIKLYTNFYIGIKNKKLDVYSLSNAKVSVLESSIDVKTDDLEKSYKVSILSDSYIISIILNDGSEIDYHFNKDWSVKNNE